MKYLKLFEEYKDDFIVGDDSEATFKNYFSRPKDVNLDFDMEYIKYAKKLSKVKKTDPKFALKVKAKDVMMQDIISIPKGIFIVLNDFKFGKYIFQKDSIVNSDGIGNLIIDKPNGGTDNIKAIGPKRGFERFYLNFYSNTKRKQESFFRQKEKDLIKLILTNDNKINNKDFTTFLLGEFIELPLEPKKEKLYRDNFVMEINRKFRNSGFDDNLILLPTGMRGAPKGQPKQFDYIINPDYLSIINDIILK